MYQHFAACAELSELVKIHGTHTHDNEDPLSYDEVLIVKVSDFRGQRVRMLLKRPYHFLLVAS